MKLPKLTKLFLKHTTKCKKRLLYDLSLPLEVFSRITIKYFYLSNFKFWFLFNLYRWTCWFFKFKVIFYLCGTDWSSLSERLIPVRCSESKINYIHTEDCVFKFFCVTRKKFLDRALPKICLLYKFYILTDQFQISGIIYFPCTQKIFSSLSY